MISYFHTKKNWLKGQSKTWWYVHEMYIFITILCLANNFAIHCWRKDMDYWYPFVLFVCLLLYSRKIYEALHFRGSMISWCVLNDSWLPLVVEIFQRYAWRYDRFTPYCNNTSIPNDQPLLGNVSSYLTCTMWWT